ncbi:MAG: hypothetical protein PHF51_02995 [Candidatus ainarchaeum sp.]|nr:hypothetical protein [Candidatus ainarchaeum sp.]
MELMLGAVRIASLLAFVSLATYFDLFNKKNVPVFIPYAMIASGIVLNVATLDFGALVSASIVALLIAAVGYVVYRTGQIGGADVLVFTGIALLMPAPPSPLIPAGTGMAFNYPFVFSVFVVSGFVALIGLSLSYAYPILRGVSSGRVKVSLAQAAPAILLSGTYLATVFVLTQMCAVFPGNRCVVSTPQGAVISLLALLAGFLMLFKDEISSRMVEWVPYSRIDEEDIVALDLLKPSLVKRLKLGPVLTAAEMGKLKKSGLKSFPIYKGMPAFLPYILLAVIVILAFGDPLAILFSG